MSLDKDDEKDLVAQLRIGNEAAFTSLYNCYSTQLFTKIMRMVNNREVASELLQDLFMKIWERREQVNPGQPFKSYLYTVGVNLVYDHFRKAAKNKKLASHLLATAIDHYIHAEEAVFHKDNLALVRNAIQKLPPQRKQVFKMCKLDGKSYEEVSKELSISTSTIRDHMVKANRVVREYLYQHRDLISYSLLITAFLYD